MEFIKTSFKSNQVCFMNVYVWDEFEPDCFDGLAFAIANSEKEAKELLMKRYSALGNNAEKVYWGKVQMFDVNTKIAFAVSYDI